MPAEKRTLVLNTELDQAALGYPAQLESVNKELAEEIGKHRAAPQAHQESERPFRSMADGAPVMTWIAGRDKLFSYFGKGWLEFTGRTMAEDLSNGWAAPVHPEDRERCLSVYTNAFEARHEFSMEYRLKRFDGEYRWVLDKGTPRYTPAGVFAGYIGCCADIGELKRTAPALRDAEVNRSAQELAALYAVTAAASHSLNPDEVFRAVIQKITEIFTFDAMGIFLLDPSGETLQLRVSCETFGQQFAHRKVSHLGVGVAGTAIATGEPLVFADVRNDPRYWALSSSKSAVNNNCGFLAAYPIKSKEKSLGVLICVGKEPRTLSMNETSLLTSMTTQIATAVENVQLFEQTKRQASQLSDSRAQLRQFAAHLESVREQERTQISRQIHDELGQTLTCLNMELAWLRNKVPSDQNALPEKIESLIALTTKPSNRCAKLPPN